MNKKEILEIKKQFTNDRCCISRICGCYVDGNKNIITTFKDAFLSLPEEEIFKYFTIFKNSLSGTIGKNLLNMDFPLEQESEGGTQEFLLQLRNSGLKDDELLNMFYQKIIDNYLYGENYLILCIDASYDVPGNSTDGLELNDASDYVYHHILSCICPVNLSKEGLCYNAESNSIENRVRDWIVEKPMTSFLFPCFNDRNTDIHSLLYYSKNPELIQSEFIDGMLGCSIPMTSRVQKDTFSELITSSLGNDCKFETIKSIHETISSIIEEKKDDPDPIVFSKQEVSKILENSGAQEETITKFQSQYDELAGPTQSFSATNISSTKTFDVKTSDVTIKVDPNRTDLISTMEVNGKQCIVIEITDQVEVNGMPIKNNL